MPALGLVALLPLLLSLILGFPGLARPVAQPAAGPISANVVQVQPNHEVALNAPAETPAAAENAAPAGGLLALLPAPLVALVPGMPAQAKQSQPVVSAPFTPILNLLHPARVVTRQGGPTPITAEQIVRTADALMGVPYVWGGTSNQGLDCSAFVSRAWGVSRRTTESLPGVAFRIDKEELLPGDILNLTMAQDPHGYGHVRLFAGWANSQHSRMWVYEETPPRSVHHVISYDPRYTPLRRINYSPGDLAASQLVSMLFGKPDTSVASPTADSGSAGASDDGSEGDDDIATATVDSLATGGNASWPAPARDTSARSVRGDEPGMWRWPVLTWPVAASAWAPAAQPVDEPPRRQHQSTTAGTAATQPGAQSSWLPSPTPTAAASWRRWQADPGQEPDSDSRQTVTERPQDNPSPRRQWPALPIPSPSPSQEGSRPRPWSEQPVAAWPQPASPWPRPAAQLPRESPPSPVARAERATVSASPTPAARLQREGLTEPRVFGERPVPNAGPASAHRDPLPSQRERRLR